MEDSRIRASLPTIQYLREGGARVILMSHLGRPRGSVVESLSLRGVSQTLSRLLSLEVPLAPDSVGAPVKKMVEELKDGDVLLLENLRFHEGETRNDPSLAEKLAGLADAYVNDAFGVSHRAHASVEAIKRFLPSYRGKLLTRELEVLDRVTRDPDRPLVLILGGGKVKDKVPVIRGLMKKADCILLGGAVGNAFLMALGHSLGASEVDRESLPVASRLIAESRELPVEILMPIDLVVSQFITADAPRETVAVERVQPGWRAVDIGPRTVERFRERIMKAGTVLWNGPMGVYEVAPFARGTRLLARAIAESEALSVIGGGDSAASLKEQSLDEKVYHVSTGGGAMLSYLSGEELPGTQGLMPLEDLT